jgi:hypothetical protein
MDVILFTTKKGKLAQEFNGVKYYPNSKGYYINKKQEITRLHRAVWIFHNGAIPDKYEVHHKDHDRAHNNLENLELLYATKHRILHGILNSLPTINIETELTCVVCKSRFVAGNNQGLYCSNSCEQKAYRKRHGRKESEAMSIKALARHEKSAIIFFTCEECNRVSEARTLPEGVPMKKYCSLRCKRKASKRRKKLFFTDKV